MLFREGKNKVNSYQIELTNREYISEVVLNLLKQGKVETIRSEHGKYFGSSSYYERGPANQYIDYTTITESHDPDLDYSDGRITTDRTTFTAPFTITFGAPAVDFRQIEDYEVVQQKYLAGVKDSDCRDKLANLLYDVEDRAALYALVAHFNGNIGMLETFLKTYHPDLAHFRGILPYIKLLKEEEFFVDEQTERLKWAHKLIVPDEIKEIEARLKTSKDNSEIADNLGLEFQGRTR